MVSLTAAAAAHQGAPWRWMQRRLTHPHRLRRGLLALAAIAVGYTLCIVVLAIGGGQPGTVPWLRIEQADYFWWEIFFIGPVIIAGGLLAAAAMHLLGRMVGGHGTFDDTLALLGPAVAVSTLFTAVPDLVIGILLWTRVLHPHSWLYGITHPTMTLGLVWGYLALYALAFLMLFPVVIGTTHRLRTGAAITIGWTGFLIYQAVLFVFVR